MLSEKIATIDLPAILESEGIQLHRKEMRLYRLPPIPVSKIQGGQVGKHPILAQK